jgi:hypothetical protein
MKKEEFPVNSGRARLSIYRTWLSSWLIIALTPDDNRLGNERRPAAQRSRCAVYLRRGSVRGANASYARRALRELQEEERRAPYLRLSSDRGISGRRSSRAVYRPCALGGYSRPGAGCALGASTHRAAALSALDPWLRPPNACISLPPATPCRADSSLTDRVTAAQPCWEHRSARCWWRGMGMERTIATPFSGLSVGA